MINVDISRVEEATNGPSLVPAGGYVTRIINVENRADKEGLVVELDIADGEYVGYYEKLNAERGFWGLSTFRSYKEKALPFFKKFVMSVERSNDGYHWDRDEEKLIGKLIGAVLQHEEYEANDGTVKTKVTVNSFDSVQNILDGKFKVPDKIILEKANRDNAVVDNSAHSFQPLTDEDTPF